MSDLVLLLLNALWAALTMVFLATVAKIYFHREQLPDATSNDTLPRLSIIVPARDEAANISECLECITHLDYPEGALEIIVVDDGSTDATASIVSEFGARDSRVKLLAAGPLPDGWVGKSHACWKGVSEASGEWLLFVDADTYLERSAAGAALTYALRTGREFLSVIPFQRIVSFQERIALPGVFLGFASAIDFKRVNDPDDPFAIANGQFLLFRRQAYEQIGGHEAIRTETSDDLAFARAVKRLRISAYTLFGEKQIETRMYRSLREVWNGFAKNAGEVMHATSVTGAIGAALVSFGIGAGSVLPFIALSASGLTDSLPGFASICISTATVVTLWLFFILSLRALRVPIVYVLAVPFGLAMHAAIIVNAYFRHGKGNREWKGRRY